MAESYLVKKLYERRDILKKRRLRSKSIILDVSNLLSSDEKLLMRRGVTFEVKERFIRGVIAYGDGESDGSIILKITDRENIEIDGEGVPDDLNSEQIYQALCDRLVNKMSAKQIMNE